MLYNLIGIIKYVNWLSLTLHSRRDKHEIVVKHSLRWHISSINRNVWSRIKQVRDEYEVRK